MIIFYPFLKIHFRFSKFRNFSPLGVGGYGYITYLPPSQNNSCLLCYVLWWINHEFAFNEGLFISCIPSWIFFYYLQHPRNYYMLLLRLCNQIIVNKLTNNLSSLFVFLDIKSRNRLSFLPPTLFSSLHGNVIL